MSSLEDRIAAVIHRESNYHRVYCAIDPAYCVVGPRDHVGAAAVVAELGLTQEWGIHDDELTEVGDPLLFCGGSTRDSLQALIGKNPATRHLWVRDVGPWRSASPAASPVEVTPE